MAGRIGFNSFNPNQFDYIEFHNILLVNLSLTAALEHRPIYHKGLFAGLGLQLSINLLPEIVPRFATGLVVTVGAVLP